MTDQELAAGDGGGERGTECKACGQSGLCQPEKRPPDKGNTHVVRIVGTYSLFTFFEEEGQRAFFKTITSEEFEKIFEPEAEAKAKYARSSGPFHLDANEEKFELRMTNMGFIREGFWREAFPPIFQLNGDPKEQKTWEHRLPKCTEGKLALAIKNPKPDRHAEAPFYQYCLQKLDDELRKAGGQQEIHIGLNRFGIVNIGITIKWDGEVNWSFKDLCKDAYKKVSHLQEDPLKDWKAQLGEKDPLITALENREKPRLLVSYFQVLAITTIHAFLHAKLVDKAIGGFQIGWLANSWELSNKLENSTREGLPPLRHVVFMYQLVHSFDGKAAFLKRNRRALLTLGHNVGWSPSNNPPFPAFASRTPLKDSSLLETSCCLIFPQGLVVVIPPSESSGEVQTVYPGGMHENTSSPCVTYRDYWKLIFKLFIRVTEARLLIGMVNRELADIHKAFLKNRQTQWFFYPFQVCIGWIRSLMDYFGWNLHARKTGEIKSQTRWLPKGVLSISSIHSRLMRVGSIIQRTSGRVITPEVTRYSFVRRKLTDFLKTVNFEEHRGYIQSEFEKLNQWMGAIRTAFVAIAAIVVAITSAILTVVMPMPWVQKWINPDGANSACATQALSESAKDLSGEMDKLKTTTTGLDFEMKQLQAKIEPLAKDLEALKRCQHHKQKAHKQ